MADEKPVIAPKYELDQDGNVIDAETKKQAQGIAVFGKPALVKPSPESPLSAMIRWRNFRQAPVDK
jgi:hypothetical protein